MSIGNINNYDFRKLDLVLSNIHYWDLCLAPDGGTSGIYTGASSGDCLAVYFDFNNPSIYSTGSTSANTIGSLTSWNKAINTGYTFNTIGLTGIDNGLITFEKLSGDTSNQNLLTALTGSTLIIPSGNTKFYLNRITGTTGDIIYPITILSGKTGNYASFCGGFYQGYYKIDGSTYEVLPTRTNYAWNAEFWLRPSSSGCTGITATTLNSLYPNNKGFFFYMGTRAENKYWNIFEGVDTGCTSGCTSVSGCTDTLSPWCTIPKETDIALLEEHGIVIPLSPPQVELELITNPFLIYGRAKDLSPKPISGINGSFIYNVNTEETTGDTVCGCYRCGGSHSGLGTKTICTYDGEGIIIRKSPQKTTNTTNPFLIYGRAHSGCSNYCGYNGDDPYGKETIYSFSGFTADITEVDYNLDIIDNSLGFRIKDDGSIGYRLLTVTGGCTSSGYTSGVTIEEKYSASGLVQTDKWSHIVIRFVSNKYLEDCELKYHPKRKGRLMIYINGYLKHTFNDFYEFIAKRLSEHKLKQVGVPYNISLGGGSQGLIESQTFDGRDARDLGLPIETNFAGTFIGDISQFKLNLCDLNYTDIKYLYNSSKNRYIQ